MIDISSSNKKGPYFKKDRKKFSICTKLIARGSRNSSSRAYALAAGSLANVGVYDASDIVGISAEGNRAGRIEPDWKEIEKAIEARVEFVTDTHEDRWRRYNLGEREVGKFLTLAGYKEYQPGRWRYSEKAHLVALLRLGDLAKVIKILRAKDLPETPELDEAEAFLSRLTAVDKLLKETNLQYQGEEFASQTKEFGHHTLKLLKIIEDHM